MQIVHLHELPVQSQVAVQDLRCPRATLQGTSPRISSVTQIVGMFVPVLNIDDPDVITVSHHLDDLR